MIDSVDIPPPYIYYSVTERVLYERMPVVAVVRYFEEDPEYHFMQYILHEIISFEIDPSRFGELGWVVHELHGGKNRHITIPLNFPLKPEYWKD